MGGLRGGAERMPDGTPLQFHALSYSQPVLPALIIVLTAVVMAFGVLLELQGDRLGRRLVAAALIVVLAVSTAYLLLESESASGPAGEPARSTTAGGESTAPAQSASDGTPAPSVEPTIVRYEVSLVAGEYTLYSVDEDGTVGAGRPVSFDGASRAPVDRVEAADGLVHWRTVVGSLAGLSYVPDRSGSFQIRAILRWPDGHTEARIVDLGS
jgi:hypothetical protein